MSCDLYFLSKRFVFCFFRRSIVDVPLPTAPFAVTSGPVVDGTSGLLKQDPIALLEKGEFTDYSVSCNPQQFLKLNLYPFSSVAKHIAISAGGLSSILSWTNRTQRR